MQRRLDPDWLAYCLNNSRCPEYGPKWDVLHRPWRRADGLLNLLHKGIQGGVLRTTQVERLSHSIGMRRTKAQSAAQIIYVCQIVECLPRAEYHETTLGDIFEKFQIAHFTGAITSRWSYDHASQAQLIE